VRMQWRIGLLGLWRRPDVRQRWHVQRRRYMRSPAGRSRLWHGQRLRLGEGAADHSVWADAPPADHRTNRLCSSAVGRLVGSNSSIAAINSSSSLGVSV
jgi:hypothetical protein